MKQEYDFSAAEQGRFYRPIDALDIPIYLDQDVKQFMLTKLKSKSNTTSLSELINSLLKKDIEITKQLSSV
ncbi:hypothetical protein [Thiomicrospira microaerophila]|uniref:hypothetical protein n=1 Tax=Thiomicrospira microaerophila TaxID=406020 RepID=UPI0005CA7E38|nr:hypothetical protein [Thiomicrospira microaerophila]